MYDTDDADGPRGARTATAIALLMLATALPLAGSAVGHAGADQLTIEASEDCPQEAYCFEVTQGSLDELQAGEEVQITFVNPDANNLDHNLYLTGLSQANPGEDTDSSAAEASTETLSPGEETTFETFIPQSFEGLYMWCDVPGHEGEGMYLQASFGGGDASTDSGDETNDSPGLGAIGGLAALGAVALGLRRARR